MKVIAVHVGKPRSVTVAGTTFRSAGAKSPVESAFLRWEGFDGDGQANRTYHGGKDRTACVYALEHYTWWNQVHGFALGPGAFAENLTVEGALEDGIRIGDVLRVGEALIQVSLPHDPCGTLDRLTGIRGFGMLAQQSGRCGFHARTVQEGLVRAGDAVEVVQEDPEGISVAMALDLYHGRSQDRELARRILAMPFFADQGKADIRRRLS
jgi:MOSC domain-containing protein YiiM